MSGGYSATGHGPVGRPVQIPLSYITLPSILPNSASRHLRICASTYHYGLKEIDDLTDIKILMNDPRKLCIPIPVWSIKSHVEQACTFLCQKKD